MYNHHSPPLRTIQNTHHHQQQQQQQQQQPLLHSLSGLVRNSNIHPHQHQHMVQQQPQQQPQQQQQLQPQPQSQQPQPQPQQPQDDSSNPALFIPLKTAKDQLESTMIHDEALIANLDDYMGNIGSQSVAYGASVNAVQTSNLYTSSSSSSRSDANAASFSAGPVVQVLKRDLPLGVVNLLRGKSDTVHIKQGLLTEIGRAWYVVNGVLIMWDYSQDGDSGLVKVDHEAGSLVYQVGLVRADPALFQGLSHLLVIAGNARVSLVGLSYDSSSRSLSLVDMLPQQPFLSAPCPPNVQFSQIVCSDKDSRVFLLGGGCLYEVVYEAKAGANAGWLGMVGLGGGPRDPILKNWTTSLEGWGNILPEALRGSRREPIKQLLADPQRGMVYALTEMSKIQRWSMGNTPNALEPKMEGALAVVDMARNATGSIFFDRGVTILHMDIINKSEADACLLLTTSTGARIYMKDGAQTRPGWGYSGPSVFHIVHVRFPPQIPQPQGAQPKSFADQPLAWSRYMEGVYATVHHQPGGSQSQLAWFTADAFEWADITFKRLQGQLPQQDASNRGNGFPESYTLLNLQSQVQDIGEEQHYWKAGSSSLNRLRSEAGGLALGTKTTHEMVTEVSVTSRRRFVVMVSGGVVIYEKVRPVDTLEYLYANGLGRSDSVLNIQRQLSASVAPLLALDIAIAAQNGSNANGGIRTKDYIPGVSAQSALDHLVTWANEQQKQKTLYHQSANAAQWKLDAVYLHLSRSLRSFWKSQVLVTSPATRTTSSAIGLGKLRDLQAQLEGLQSLLAYRSNIFSSVDPTFVSDRIAAALPNADTFNPPKILLAQTIEAIAFVILLSEFNFEAVIPRCDPELQRDLVNITYSQLIVEPRARDLAKRLVTNVVNQQISQDRSIELISDRLQDRCPSFCSRADVDLYKAMESLRKAKELRAGVERQAHLDSALDNFMRAAPGLSYDKISEVCTDFCSLGYASGCIQLPIEKAEQIDPDHIAFSYYLDHRPKEDARSGYYESRLRFYQLALKTLARFEELASQDAGDAVQHRAQAYEFALNTGDDLFLMTLYEWMIESKGNPDQLLELDNDSKVESYLRYRGLTSGAPDLLWRFYARRNRHYMAAQALRELAQAPIQLPMGRRVECLALASMHAKSSTVQETERAPVDFVTELEETNDVANIQMEIWQAIANDSQISEEGAVKAEELQADLKTISELFSNYAEPLRLYESQLTILHASDHRDAEMVADIWNALLLKVDTDAESYGSKQKYRALTDLVVRLGKRFYPSYAAFPTSIIVQAYYDRGFDEPSSPAGWVTSALIDAGIPYHEIWDTLGRLVQDVAPFNEQDGKRYIDRELSVLVPKWIDAAQSGQESPFFPGLTDYMTMRTSDPKIDPSIKSLFDQSIRQIVDLLRTTRTF